MTIEFEELKRIPMRQVWDHEEYDFSPWLGDNIEALGDALGLELELTDREASVGGFNLDLLAKDLGSNDNVIIENQYGQTDHDHLGKLLTYAAGFEASSIIWIAEKFRDEHRQALDFLNQRTDTSTRFFAVIVEVLQIGDGPQAYNFDVVVQPNEWAKTTKAKAANREDTLQYYEYFQSMIDELTNYGFPKRKPWKNSKWYGYNLGGGIYDSCCFRKGITTCDIYLDSGDKIQNKKIFDALNARKDEIESALGFQVDWLRHDNKNASRIQFAREGTIETDWDELRDWHTKIIIKMKEVFEPILNDIKSSMS